MKYIIMCGGNYPGWEIPRQMQCIKCEPIVLRTIRLLLEAGAKDIAISSNNKRFNIFGVPVLKHENTFVGYRECPGSWVEAFYPTEETACYLMGDVVFSPEAIKTIVDTDTDDIEFFASCAPFSAQYIKKWAEPFAFKVKNQKHFRESIDFVKNNDNLFRRKPIAWELWQVIKGTPLNRIDYTNYTVINDYTCDIDSENDLRKMREVLRDNDPCVPAKRMVCEWFSHTKSDRPGHSEG